MLEFIKTIVYINDKTGTFGGTEEYLNSLSLFLKRQGIRSSIIYGESKGELSDDIDDYFHLPELAVRDSTANLAPKISEILEHLEPDVVYIHNIFNPSVFKALNTPERPYVVLFYLHDHYFTCLTELRMNSLQPNGVCERLLSEECLSQITKGNCLKRFTEASFDQGDLAIRQQLITALSSVDAVVVVSPYMKDLIIKHHPDIRKKVWFIPRQVRCRNLTDDGRVDAESLRMGFVGRITYEKGLHVALSALALLHTEQPVEFEIAGVIEHRDYWKRCEQIIARIHVENPNVKVTYKGELSYPKVDALYNTMDITIFPSLWGEPLGIVAAEAMCHGCAVIASNVGGISLWLNEKTGILVEPDKPEAIVSAMERLASDSELMRRLARKGRRLVLEKFNEEQHLKTLNQILITTSFVKRKYKSRRD